MLDPLEVMSEISAANASRIMLFESVNYKSSKKVSHSSLESILYEEIEKKWHNSRQLPVSGLLTFSSKHADDINISTTIESFTESPGAKISQSKNLTGNPRIVRDLAATIHASIQQWNSVHLHGLSVLKAITQMKLDETYPEGLQDLCEDLTNDCEKLDEIVKNLNQAAVQLNAVKSLHKGQDKLFQTWPVEHFAETSNLIYEAYRDEAAVKHKILENVAHDHRESWKMLHLAAWVHQTQIPDSIATALESMLVETWHR